jgi:predicted HAD superfamily phosphohydrolase
VNRKIERISNVSVLDIELTTSKLTVWRKKHESGRTVDVLTTFFVAKGAQIKDVHGHIIPLSKIKPGTGITVDYAKEKDGRFVASNILVTVKSQERR